MLTKEHLEKLSAEELETIYQQKKIEFEKMRAKNRRIHSMLYRKIDDKQKNIKSLNTEISKLIEVTPELKDYLTLFEISLSSEDDYSDPNLLYDEISDLKNVLLKIELTSMDVKKNLTETKKHLEASKNVKQQLQEEITTLNSELDSSSITDEEEAEQQELNRLTKESQSLQSELEELQREIDDLRQKIHRKG